MQHISVSFTDMVFCKAVVVDCIILLLCQHSGVVICFVDHNE